MREMDFLEMDRRDLVATGGKTGCERAKPRDVVRGRQSKHVLRSASPLHRWVQKISASIGMSFVLAKVIMQLVFLDQNPAPLKCTYPDSFHSDSRVLRVGNSGTMVSA